ADAGASECPILSFRAESKNFSLPFAVSPPRTQPVNFEFCSPHNQRCAFGKMLCKFGIVLQPPKRVGCENKMGGATTAQFFKIDNQLPVVARIALVDSIFLEKVPAPPFCIIENGRIAVIGSDDQCIWDGELS